MSRRPLTPQRAEHRPQAPGTPVQSDRRTPTACGGTRAPRGAIALTAIRSRGARTWEPQGAGRAGHQCSQGADPPPASSLSIPHLPQPEHRHTCPLTTPSPASELLPLEGSLALRVQARHPLQPLPPAAAASPSAPAGAPRNCHDDARSEGPEPCGSPGTHVAPDTRLCLAPRQTCPAVHHEALLWASSSAHRPDDTPPPTTAFQLSPTLGKLVADSVAVRMRLAPSLLAAQGGGVRASWVRVSHRARLRSWLCSDPKGTLTFGTSGSHLAKWE